MQPFTSTIRVSYSDTDQMGFVHHSNYLKYYETARWNFFRHLGIPYKEVEEKGFLLPVVDVQIEYIKPAFYDDVLKVETSIISVKGARLTLNYKLFNGEQELINRAKITLAFLNLSSRKPCKPPAFILESLQSNLKKKLQPM